MQVFPKFILYYFIVHFIVGGSFIFGGSFIVRLSSMFTLFINGHLLINWLSQFKLNEQVMK